MNAWTFLAVAVAGGIGAALRYTADSLVRARFSGSFPLGTFLINVSGSFLIGLVAGALPIEGIPGVMHTVVVTGLLGGYTTFSTASFETVRLAQQRKKGLALANSIGMIVGAVLAALVGLLLGGWLDLL